MLQEFVCGRAVHRWEAGALSEDEETRLRDLVQRRQSGEPLQYLLGEWAFYGLPFRVTPEVLIPRQESEVLVELAIGQARARDSVRILDLCCGSGCIGIAVARHMAGEHSSPLLLADICSAALNIARENAARHGVAAECVQSDLFATIGGKFDLILCNPPYLSAADMEDMQRELNFEPRRALYGGEDGLDFYRRIAADYRDYLAPGGVMLLEIGSAQAEAVRALFPGCSVYRDYAGHERVCEVRN